MATTADAKTTTQAGRGSARLTLWHLSLVLVVIALLITGYLTYAKLTSQAVACIESGPFDCEAVQSSLWSEIGGIPISLLGFLAHLTIGAILVLEKRTALFREYGAMILFGITLVGSLYHVYLIYVSEFLIKALCPWCLSAAAIMFVQFGISMVRMRRALRTEQ